MPDATIHQFDSGVSFIFTVEDSAGAIVDLSAVQSVTVYFLRPDQTLLTVPGSVVGNGTQGVVQYVSEPTDFNQPGNWKFQLVVDFAVNDIKHTDIGTLKVLPNISPA